MSNDTNPGSVGCIRHDELPSYVEVMRLFHKPL